MAEKHESLNGAEAAKIVFRSFRSPFSIPKEKYLPLVEALFKATGDAKTNDSNRESFNRGVIICRHFPFSLGKVVYDLHFELCKSSISAVIINRKTGAWGAFGIALDGSTFKEYVENFFDLDAPKGAPKSESKMFAKKFQAMLNLHGGLKMNVPDDHDNDSPTKAPIRRMTQEGPDYTHAVSHKHIPPE